MEKSLDLEQHLGGLHEWQDVQGVVQTTFQALYDVANAQSNTVRELEQRLGECREELEVSIGRKADAADVRQAVSIAGDARVATDVVAQRLEEEAQCVLESQRTSAGEVQALRASVGELRSAVERQRADVQQWRTGFEAGLTRLMAECTTNAQAVQAECKAELQHEMERLQQEVSRLSTSLEEKASPDQLREIVREAWQREEGHLARLQRVCESKVSANDFAALVALAEGKASPADVEASVQRNVQRRLGTLVSQHQFVGKGDVAGIAEEVGTRDRERLREAERRVEEISRRQHRTSAVADELRTELRTAVSTKLERAEVEALVAGALADWVRAAQRGADAVQAALSRGKVSHEASWVGLDGIHSVLLAGEENSFEPASCKMAWSPPSPRGASSVTETTAAGEEAPRSTPPAPAHAPLLGRGGSRTTSSCGSLQAPRRAASGSQPSTNSHMGSPYRRQPGIAGLERTVAKATFAHHSRSLGRTA